MKLDRKQRCERSFGEKDNECEFRSVELEILMENSGRVTRKSVGPELNREGKTEMHLQMSLETR